MDMNREPPLPAEPESSAGGTRRKFLKGTALALPAVVTLHSGAALANSSIACSNVKPPYYTKVLCDNYPDQDNCHRVKRELYKKLDYKNTGTSKKPKWDWVISTTDTNGHYFEGQDPLGKSCWRYAADGKCVPNTAQTSTSSPHHELDAVKKYCISPAMKCGKQKYAICHVSLSTGYPVAIGTPCDEQNNVPGCVVTSWQGSCLASIIGHKTI